MASQLQVSEAKREETDASTTVASEHGRPEAEKSSPAIAEKSSPGIRRSCGADSEQSESSLPYHPQSNVPRTSSCCVVITVLCIMLTIGTLTYFVSFDGSKKFASWWERFFTSEKELTKDGPLVLTDYDAGQWAYFIILCVVCFINLSIVIPTLTVVLRRRCKSIPKKLAQARTLKDATVEAILPCYLPNEKDIIEETVWYLLKHVETPGDFKLWLVYNTPNDMPEIEARLHALADRLDLPHGRKLAVVRATSSKSKAENINLILPQLTAKYTVIYDADHHPDPESLLLMIEKIERKNLSCVQGSTYIRNLDAGIMGRVIDAEFFVTHFVYFPCMRLLTRNAVFAGSNGLWRTKVVQGTCFDHKMQTEDIDVSVRMLLEKHTIDFCPEARSGELAPVSVGALFKQRQRWAIGWDQVSLFHFSDIFRSDARLSRKFAVGWVLYSRWLMQLVGIIAGVASPILIFIQRQSVTLCHCGMGTRLLENTMFYFYIALVLSCTVEALCQIRHRGLQSLIQVFFVGLFMFAGCVYILFQALLIVISLFKISTGRVGGWAVTARGKQNPAASRNAAGGAVTDEKPSKDNKATAEDDGAKPQPIIAV